MERARIAWQVHAQGRAALLNVHAPSWSDLEGLAKRMGLAPAHPMRERTNADKRRLDSQLRKQAVIMILVSALAVGIGLVAMNWMVQDEPPQAPTGPQDAAAESDPIAVDAAPPGGSGTDMSGAEDDGTGSDRVDAPP